MSDELPAVMTVQQAAAYLSLSPQYLYLMICQKRFPHYKLGRAVRISRTDADAWLAEHRVASLA